jgi:hypothetical protein
MNPLLLNLTVHKLSQTLTEIRIFGTDVHLHDQRIVMVKFNKLESYPTVLFINYCPGKPR